MEHPNLPTSLLRAFVTTCTLGAAVACSSSAATNVLSGTRGGGGDGATRADDDSGADASADAAPGAADADAASDAGQKEAGPPPAVASCKAGDRTEWSGVVANTGVAVAVCSACGESYVVASAGGAVAGTVTVDNGSKTITVNVPAGGTATSASIADRASDGTVKVCATGGTSQACLPEDPQNQRYCNPYRSVAGLVPERIDQGVDYAGSGPIYAMGPGTIDLWNNRNDSGWPGGTFASYKITAGPAAGKEIYLAENIDLNPTLKPGSFVWNGTSLGTLVNAYPNSESGWGVPGAGYTAEYSCYTEGCMTPLGVNFNNLLVCLKAPSGTTGTGGCCPQPTGYPTDWCSLLGKWQ